MNTLGAFRLSFGDWVRLTAHSGTQRIETCIRGRAYWRRNGLEQGGCAAGLPGPGESISRWVESLSKSNGFFALIRIEANRMIAAVDAIRSIPLFYGIRAGKFILSDDAEWVRDRVGDRQMDKLAREEFAASGFVVGRDTLFTGVKQLQAGELLVALEHDGAWSYDVETYYRFIPEEEAGCDRRSMREELDAATLSSVRRLVDYAGGRQIVVPLSGGYDSRLIAASLNRVGYKNVLAYTYGIAGNQESDRSRQVALRMGIPWRFIEYTPESWRQAWGTEDRKAYQRRASNLTSLPHYQDWLAVKEMKEKKQVDPRCGFAPGHCCVTGL